MRYTSADVAKLISFSPTRNGVELHSSVSDICFNDFPTCSKISVKLEKCRKLIQIAEKSIKGVSNCYYGIDACNEVLGLFGGEIGPTLMHQCLCVRASLFLKRRWKNDAHMAIRDCHQAWKINPSSVRALICMAEALSMLDKHKQALDFAFAAQSVAPSDFEVMERVEIIKKNIAAAEVETGMQSDRVSKSEIRGGRALSLSDMIHHPDANNDASVDGPNREDPDYDDVLELDSDTSISGEVGDFLETGFINRILNSRILGTEDSGMENERSGGSYRPDVLSNENDTSSSAYASILSSSESDRMPYQPEAVTDMKQRYVGHCNIGTDIKQASFIGQRGEFVASGSDDGRWFIWDKVTGRLLKMLRGDEAVVNCIQCHPYDCAVATSGIDSTIKIWTPSSPVPSIVAGGAAGPETSNVLDAMEGNQRKLCRTREATLPFEILERFRMHEFTEGRFHPFECMQS